MSDYPRFTINRSLVLILPNRPFYDWVMAVDPEPDPAMTLAEIRHEQDAFLLPGEESIEVTDDAVKWVEKRWRVFFEYMLSEWFADESLWPRKRTLSMFREWFTIQFYPMVYDLADTPIVHEDWEDDDDDEEGGALQ